MTFPILSLREAEGDEAILQHNRKCMDYNSGKEPNDLKMPVEIKLGDVVRLRKPHPCGSYEWEVVRAGADIGLKCLKCQRGVLLARDVFRRRVKNVVAKSN
jgi:hypothetical protein